MNELIIFYRLSDKGNPKNRLSNVNNKKCLENFIKEFAQEQIVIIADNVLDETMEWLRLYNFKQLHRTTLGNSGSFWYIFELALKLDKNDCVYFVENDYIHKPNSRKVLLEGLQIADYVTLYDHPDKYVDGINPGVKNGGEQSKVFLSESTHWKITNSTTMTFATKVKILEKDRLFFKIFSVGITKSRLPLIKKFSGNPNPRDYRLFTSLSKVKNRILISPMPGYSTHGEKEYLAPFTDWESLID